MPQIRNVIGEELIHGPDLEWRSKKKSVGCSEVLILEEGDEEHYSKNGVENEVELACAVIASVRGLSFNYPIQFR